MIHVRIDNHNSTAVDIYVNISPNDTIRSSSPISSLTDYKTKENVYDRLFDKENVSFRQSKIVKSRPESMRPINKKNYTLEQILDNVEAIQKQYEKVVTHQAPSSSSCFFPFKKLTKVLKNLRTMKPKLNNEIYKTTYSEPKSPFIFGGETLQWIALPQDDSHIYENAFIP